VSLKGRESTFRPLEKKKTKKKKALSSFLVNEFFFLFFGAKNKRIFS